MAATCAQWRSCNEDKNYSSAMLYKSPSHPVEARVEDLLSRMTLAEKIGQMTQIDRAVASSSVIKERGIGSVLNGGGSMPAPLAKASQWADMIDSFQDAAMSTRLAIPMIYGTDAIHGHNNVYGATIFPHNIGLGATRDPDLVRRIGTATALEVRATGIPYTFAPCVAVSRDPRWGRCYESYSEDTEIVRSMTDLIIGLQGSPPVGHPNGYPYVAGGTSVAACAKHFVADGGTDSGINEHNTLASYDELYQIHMLPYLDSLAKGVSTIMVSYSSWNGEKMHAHHFLLTRVLKEQLGFKVIYEFLQNRLYFQASYPVLRVVFSLRAVLLDDSVISIAKCHEVHLEVLSTKSQESHGPDIFKGFVISDWEGLDRLTSPPGSNYRHCVSASINAGIDMVMVPFNYQTFIDDLTTSVESNEIPMSRIDDAVRRILRVKFIAGLFENPKTDRSLLGTIGNPMHRELAREAVRKSLVLLKNGKSYGKPLLPLNKNAPKILVAGSHANNLGYQCGGWTISWAGGSGPTTIGTTILDAIRLAVGPSTQVVFEENPDSDFVDGKGFSYAIVVIGEPPYAETLGDNSHLTIPLRGIDVINNVCSKVESVVMMISGRPLVVEPYLKQIDAFVAAWLPGTEGQGVTDVIFGDHNFQGRLSRTWFKRVDQLPMNIGDKHYDPLFPLGFGIGMHTS